jgi:hypothetical protein
MSKIVPSSSGLEVPPNLPGPRVMSSQRRRKLRRRARSEAEAGLPGLRSAREHCDTPLIAEIRSEAADYEARLLFALEQRFKGLLLPLSQAATLGDRPAPPVGRGPVARHAAEAVDNYDNVLNLGQAALTSLVDCTRSVRALVAQNADYATYEIAIVKAIITEYHPDPSLLDEHQWNPREVIPRLHLAVAPAMFRPYVEQLLRPLPRLIADGFRAELLPLPMDLGQPQQSRT